MKNSVYFSVFILSCSSLFVGRDAYGHGTTMPEMPDLVKHDVDSDPVTILNIFQEHGLTDPHAMVVGDRLYVGCGHDQS